MNQIGDKVRKYEVLKFSMKTLTFVDADANTAAEGSTIALRERCSGELKSSVESVSDR